MLGFNIRRGSKELILLRIYGLLWLALVLGWWYRHVLEAVGFCLAVNFSQRLRVAYCCQLVVFLYQYLSWCLYAFMVIPEWFRG